MPGCDRKLRIPASRFGPQARAGLLSAVQRSAYFLALAAGPAGGRGADAEYGGPGAFDDWAADGMSAVERSLGRREFTQGLSQKRSMFRGARFIGLEAKRGILTG